MVDLVCRQCGSVSSVPDGEAAREFICPACGNLLAVERLLVDGTVERRADIGARVHPVDEKLTDPQFRRFLLNLLLFIPIGGFMGGCGSAMVTDSDPIIALGVFMGGAAGVWTSYLRVARPFP